MSMDILLIDDDPLVRAAIRAMLEDAGYTVRSVGDGRAGMKAFRKKRPDLVITDIIMPEREGLETIIEMRTLWPEGPIIAISGGGRDGNADFLQMAERLGANTI